MNRTDLLATKKGQKYCLAGPGTIRALRRMTLILVWAMLLPADLVAEEISSTSPSAPLKVVAKLQSGLIDASNTYADASMEERYAALEPLIKETHDLPYIARFAMRRYWADLTDEQRSEFMDTFTRLSIATYASRFQGLTDETFGISGQTDRPRGHVEINGTLVQKDGEALGINYILHQSDEDWRIINIIVDGVSDLALKRAEFQRVFLDAGFTGLLTYLSGQIDEAMPSSPTDSQ
jgi:phospholipid transport system substrate-binding protein